MNVKFHLSSRKSSSNSRGVISTTPTQTPRPHPVAVKAAKLAYWGHLNRSKSSKHIKKEGDQIKAAYKKKSNAREPSKRRQSGIAHKATLTQKKPSSPKPPIVKNSNKILCNKVTQTEESAPMPQDFEQNMMASNADLDCEHVLIDENINEQPRCMTRSTMRENLSTANVHESVPKMFEEEVDEYVGVPQLFKEEKDEYVGIPKMFEEEEDEYVGIPKMFEEEEDEYVGIPKMFEEEEDEYVGIPKMFEEDDDEYVGVPQMFKDQMRLVTETSSPSLMKLPFKEFQITENLLDTQENKFSSVVGKFVDNSANKEKFQKSEEEILDNKDTVEETLEAFYISRGKELETKGKAETADNAIIVKYPVAEHFFDGTSTLSENVEESIDDIYVTASPDLFNFDCVPEMFRVHECAAAKDNGVPPNSTCNCVWSTKPNVNTVCDLTVSNNEKSSSAVSKLIGFFENRSPMETIDLAVEGPPQANSLEPFETFQEKSFIQRPKADIQVKHSWVLSGTVKEIIQGIGSGYFQSHYRTETHELTLSVRADTFPVLGNFTFKNSQTSKATDTAKKQISTKSEPLEEVWKILEKFKRMASEKERIGARSQERSTKEGSKINYSELREKIARQISIFPDGTFEIPKLKSISQASTQPKKEPKNQKQNLLLQPFIQYADLLKPTKIKQQKDLHILQDDCFEKSKLTSASKEVSMRRLKNPFSEKRSKTHKRFPLQQTNVNQSNPNLRANRTKKLKTSLRNMSAKVKGWLQ